MSYACVLSCFSCVWLTTVVSVVSQWQHARLPYHQILGLTQTQVHPVSDAIQPSHPLLSPSPPAFSLSQNQGLFKWVSSLHQVAKVLEFQLQHQSPSNEYSVLISLRIDWLDLLAVQEILKSLLQHHSSKPSILQHSAFFIVQLSQLYTTTEKTIALTRWTFIGKVICSVNHYIMSVKSSTPLKPSFIIYTIKMLD